MSESKPLWVCSEISSENYCFYWKIKHFQKFMERSELSSPDIRGLAGGQQWKLLIKPKVMINETEFMSLELRIESFGPFEVGQDYSLWNAKARFQLSVVDSKGKTIKDGGEFTHKFTPTSKTAGIKKFHETSKLFDPVNGLGVDNTIIFKCHIWIIDCLKESHGYLKDNDLKDNDLKDNELKDNDLKDNELKDNDLKDNDLKDNDLKNNELKDNELKDNELKDNELTDGSSEDPSQCSVV